ncbi:MAG TPA: hypothetical protein VF647_00995 [Longimicrobium sp.]|jgi:hypothetical protein
MTRIHVLALAALLSGVASPAALAGQGAAGAYRASNTDPQGREVVAILISSSTCIANQQAGFKPAVREMMRRLGVQRDSAKLHLSITGVSTDWEPRVAVSYFEEFGEFDELVVGRNWFNSAITQHVWQTEGARSVIPQIILLERTVTQGERGLRITGERVIGRFWGGDEIMAWAARGAPLPAADSTAAAGGSRR